jgi:DNA-binding protein HU-beta
MNKSELVAEIAKNTKLTQKTVAETLDSFMDTVRDTLKKGEKITLVGFGTFQVRQRKATTGVNPKTKQKINIPAKKVAKLQFSDVVNDMLNGK